MEGHLIRATLSESGSVDVALALRSGTSELLLLDIDYRGPTPNAAVLRILDRFIREARSYRRVIVRVPETDRDRLLSLEAGLAAWLRTPGTELGIDEFCLLTHEIGSSAELLLWSGEHFTELARDDVTAVRQHEIAALVVHYGALHQGSDVRFVMPSGGVANSFLRTADVLQSERDARVLALWCMDEVSDLLPDPAQTLSLSLLVDTPGLLPICYELWRILEQRNVTPGIITVAPSYPHAGGEVDSLVRSSLASADLLVSIVSASATGTMAALFARGIRRVVGPDFGKVVVLASIDLEGNGRRAEISEGERALCRVSGLLDSTAGQDQGLVRIEPSTLRLLPYSSRDAGVAITAPSHVQWLQFLAEIDGVGLECLPHSRREVARPRSGLMAFRVLLERVSTNAQELATHVDPTQFSVLPKVAHVVVMSEEDSSGSAWKQDVRTFLEAVGVLVETVITVRELDLLPPATHPVLCFAWGSVTGQTAAELVRSARVAKGGSEQTSLCVVHLRPPSRNDGVMLRKVVADGHLVVCWEQLLPWKSALEPEALVLADFLDTSPQLDQEALELAFRRVDLVSPIGAEQGWEERRTRWGWAAAQVLWCDARPPEISWISHTPTLLLAAASALEEARAEHADSFRLNLRSTVEASVSPRWIAALLRQCKRGEVSYWTGTLDRDSGADFIADWLLTDRPERELLLAEALCADVLGKLPSDLVERLVPAIESLIDDETFNTDASAAFRLLIAMHFWSRGATGPVESR